jgi:hypothetical protein
VFDCNAKLLVCDCNTKLHVFDCNAKLRVFAKTVNAPSVALLPAACCRPASWRCSVAKRQAEAEPATEDDGAPTGAAPKGGADKDGADAAPKGGAEGEDPAKENQEPAKPDNAGKAAKRKATPPVGAPGAIRPRRSATAV